MADRLTELVVGLQRMAENAVIKGDDLEYVQQQERNEYVAWLDLQIAALDKARASYMGLRRKFVPEQRERVQQLAEQKDRLPEETIPRVIQKGPYPTNPLKRETGT